ncbi:50S ribosomal protein L2 [Candidatus Vidania fulgoroideorum]
MIQKVLPTSPGVRGKVKIKFKFTKIKRIKNLVSFNSKKNGRNNQGKITVKHRGGGVKKKYIMIDFIRKESFSKGVIKSIEYDPNRNSFISQIFFTNGKKVYLLHIKNTKIGDIISNGENVENKLGNCKPINNIPIGTKICCLEIIPNKGAKILRAAGSSGIILSKDNKHCSIKLISGEIRKFNKNCRAVIGEISNEKFKLKKIGKAGLKIKKGIRPTVRGVAKNPIDHPHGGGEGKTSSGRHPVTPWGKKTKGLKTRKKKNKLILKSR